MGNQDYVSMIHLNAECEQDYKSCPLHDAAVLGDLTRIKALLDTPDGRNDLESRDSHDYTPLLCAAYGGHKDCVVYLTENGADVTAFDRDEECTALHFMAAFGHSAACSALVSKGAHINAPDSQGRSPLHCAARNGRTPCCQALVELGADASPFGEQNLTAAHCAALYGHTETCAAMIRAALPYPILEIPYGQGKHTPLHCAAVGGHVKTVLMLLKEGSDAGTLDEKQYTALHHASARGLDSVVAPLVSAGANVNGKGSPVTPLQLTLSSDQSSAKTVSALIKQGADINARSEVPVPPIHMACLRGSLDIVKIVFAAGADVNSVGSNDDDTIPAHALHCAAQSEGKDSVKIIEFLIKNGAKKTQKDFLGRTPLHVAAEALLFDNCKALVAQGFSIDDRNLEGRTPLDVAKMAHANGSIELDPHQPNSFGHDEPLHQLLSGKKVIEKKPKKGGFACCSSRK